VWEKYFRVKGVITMAKRSQNEGPVVIEQGGRKIAGNYSAQAGKVTVTTLFRSETSVISRMGGLATRAVAESLLRRLAKEGRA